MNSNSTERIGHLAAYLQERVSQNVFGHQVAAQNLLAAFLVGGHVLVEGPPGIAKTLLAKTFAESLGLDFRRVQFTPDLMPSDVTGVNIFDPKAAQFRFSAGPIFTEILLADEINRTPPKTQAALLEAMEERQVTLDGERHALSPLFFVVATQNPIEHEGTFPLPEAQLDRFLFKLVLSYPAREAEVGMISTLSGPIVTQTNSTPATLNRQDLLEFRRLIREVHLADSISDYILRIAEATRSHPSILLGASPRAALMLALASKAKAAFAGRMYVIPDDVQDTLSPVLNHRLILKPQLLEDFSSVHGGGANILEEIVRRVPVPEKISGTS